jgi:hypothetical protein
MAMPSASGFAGAYAGYGGGNQISGPGPMSSGIPGNYSSQYQAAFQNNQHSYDSILAGFQQTAAQQQARQAAIAQGYTDLYGSIKGELQGSNDAQQSLINRNYAQQRGQQSQQLINRGLGNSTIQSAVDRGLTLDQALALNENAGRFAQLGAGYHQTIGLASQAYQGGAEQAQTGLANQQLDFMNSVSSPYPDAGMYAAIEAANERNANGRNSGGGGYRASGMGGVSPSRFGSFSGPTPQYGTVAGYSADYGGGGYSGYGQYGGYVPTTQEAAAQTPYYDAPAQTYGDLYGIGGGEGGNMAVNQSGLYGDLGSAGAWDLGGGYYADEGW